jgi:hypothetical protein
LRLFFKKVPRPFPLGFVFGLVGAIALAGFYFVTSLSPGIGIECAFKKWTGFPCPTCGGTRSIHALAHGRIGEAFTLNPLVFAGILALGAWALTSLAVEVIVRREIDVELTRSEKWMARGMAAAVLLSGWAYLLARADRL